MVVAAGMTAAGEARAEAPPVDLRADDVVFDARQKELDLTGNVRVDSSPFHLSSDRLRVWRSSRGVVVKGRGKLAFCPCLGTPLTVGFKGATVAPPGDLVLESPRLELYGIPVFWAPFFWLRSPARFGLLPPDVAYRGGDGFFLGEGLHLPWNPGDEKDGVDVRGGGYFNGGFAGELRLRTPASATRVRVDDLRGDFGLEVDARGASTADREGEPSAAWNVDMYRGARAVTATTELDAASRVFDRAGAEMAWRGGGFTFASGLAASSVRGDALERLGAAGPRVSAERSEALGSLGAYDASIEGGSYAGAGAPTLSYARARGGALLATRLGAVGASFSARGTADAAAVTSTEGYDAAGSARGELTLPLGRAYPSSRPDDPWLHRIEPRVAVSALASRGDDLFGYLPSAGGVRGGAWVGEAGVSTALGRWGARDGFEASGALGTVGDDVTARPVARWRASASGRLIGLGAEGAHVLVDAKGYALSARGRLGDLESLYLAMNVAGRQGVDPVMARALTDAPLEPSSGFLATEGWTGGARLGVPWGRYVTTQGGVDADLTAGEVLAARGSIELRDRCGCLAVRAMGAGRVGRPGVDVWITIDLAPGSR